MNVRGRSSFLMVSEEKEKGRVQQGQEQMFILQKETVN